MLGVGLGVSRGEASHYSPLGQPHTSPGDCCFHQMHAEGVQLVTESQNHNILSWKGTTRIIESNSRHQKFRPYTKCTAQMLLKL